MARLVQVQTLRGNAGVAEAIKAVEGAVDKRNATAKDVHVVHSFVALPPNVKGMQVHLSLLAVLARSAGCTLVRLSVHNGNVALCGPADAVGEVLAHSTDTYNAMVTSATAAYVPATHGPRMGFMNAYLCGYTAGMDTTPAELAYGLGMLFSFPAPGNGTAYALGADAAVKADAGSTPAPKSRQSRQPKAA